MRKRVAIAGVILGLLAAGEAFAARHYRFADGTRDFYLGHISFVELQGDGEDPVVLRAGSDKAETAALNLPIGPGDIVRTSASRRCEIQFDSGTIIRLDVGTELRVETLLAKSLSSPLRISSLGLEKGRLYLMYKEYGAEEMFQILTPNAALKMKHQTVAIVRAAADRSTDVQVKFGRVSVLLGADEKTSRRQEVNRSERLIVLADNQVQMASYIADTDFDLWNEEINKNFAALHKGKSALPRPLSNLPPAVHYFAQNFGNANGEWLWDDISGYVWRPFLNDGRYPWGGWQPYFYGQWSEFQGQMYWVPEEPWGWIPYHLGIWNWDQKKGWFWIPGSFFAPAWADWEFFFGHYGWRPLTLWDYTSWGFDNFGGGYGFYYGGDDWHYNWPSEDPPKGRTVTVVRRDELKKPGGQALPIPREIKNAARRLAAAYEKGEAGVRESLAGVPASLRFVRRENIGSRKLQEKAVALAGVPRISGLPAAKDAPRVVGVPLGENLRGWRAADMGRGRGRGPEFIRTMGPRAFRDWNPDITVARMLGVRIQYSGAKNEIRCPELKISSADRSGRGIASPIMTPGGLRSFGGGGGYSGASSGGSSSSGNVGHAGTHGATAGPGHSGGGASSRTKN